MTDVPWRALPAFAREILASLGAGAGPVRRTLAAAPRSHHFNGHTFRNIEPGVRPSPATVARLVRETALRRGAGRPSRPVPVVRPEFGDAAADLAATWLGHASVLIEMDGARVLADPALSERVSPAGFVGPRRMHRAPATVAELPPLDAIVISHDHYDHLDQSTVVGLARLSAAPFLVPLGLGAHLRCWGVPAARVIELDWTESRAVAGLTIVCTPARHFSGRALTRNVTLWSSFAIVGGRHRVFFGGDTGFTSGFAEIGRDYGPFDLTVLPIGAYDDAWPDIHMTPEEARDAHRDLGGAVMLPIHWATFDLARHRWADPIERLVAAACAADRIVTPRPGERVVLAAGAAGTGGAGSGRDRWWR